MIETIFQHQEPEFYDNGVVLTFEGAGKTVEIHRDGEALLYFDRKGIFGTVNVVRTPEEFRETFPYGIPDDEDLLAWRLNAWFDLYTEDGEHLDSICHTLDEAIFSAEQHLR